MANRNTGKKLATESVLSEAQQVRADAVLEDQDDRAVGRADRQQVHNQRLHRDDDAAEHDHQQDEALSVSTKPITMGRYCFIWSTSSIVRAVPPPTSTSTPLSLAKACGMYCERS